MLFQGLLGNFITQTMMPVEISQTSPSKPTSSPNRLVYSLRIELGNGKILIEIGKIMTTNAQYYGQLEYLPPNAPPTYGASRQNDSIDRNITRTPSPTPSETAELQNTGFFDFAAFKKPTPANIGELFNI